MSRTARVAAAAAVLSALLCAGATTASAAVTFVAAGPGSINWDTTPATGNSINWD
ncbi:hypothetical protein [Streptomyces sp. H34-S4]|uniref:hypothetical protein n=1 Tax=Streptomyces sp. H34-S4 TaxID=2996463 RepID=UPI00226DD6E5|nr:hypothetical protein [Streptomyces sp. H34-S4]MCY0934867.1 hypothetical protein [Streptomyces sp. H34-S4]